MKFISCLLFILPVVAFGQESYPWQNIESILFYDLSAQGSDCKIDNLDRISVKPIFCSVADWKEPLNNLSLFQYDLRSESCYVLLIKFSDNLIIPFQYFPSQKVIMDLRPDKWINILHFDLKTHTKLDGLIKGYIRQE